MNDSWCVAWRSSLAPSSSRRSTLAALGSVLLAAAPLSRFSSRSDAKGSGRKRKRRDKRRKRKARTQPAVVRADARCVGNSDIDFGVIENGREAQTFTALSSGALVKAELTIAKDENALDDWILRVSPVDSAGFPTSNILAETFVPDTSVPLGASAAVTFEFAKPATVTVGVTYALVLTRGEFFRWAGRDGNPCEGQGFASSNQVAPFDRISVDHVFTTFVAS